MTLRYYMSFIFFVIVIVLIIDSYFVDLFQFFSHCDAKFDIETDFISTSFLHHFPHHQIHHLLTRIVTSITFIITWITITTSSRSSNSASISQPSLKFPIITFIFSIYLNILIFNSNMTFVCLASLPHILSKNNKNKAKQNKIQLTSMLLLALIVITIVLLL